MNAAGKQRDQIGWLGITLLISMTLIGLVFVVNASKADAAPTVVANSDFQTKWDGPAANTRLGNFVVGLGDVNGDGITDYAVNVNQPAHRSVWVLFGPTNPQTVGSFNNLPPEDGYRISGSGNATWLHEVGDQNSDGKDDVLVQRGANLTVVYSLAEPATELPECDGTPGAPITRCLDLNDPRNLAGDRQGFALTSATAISGSSWSAGDLDGDGKSELVAPGTTGEKFFVLENGLGSKCGASPGLCSVNIDALEAPDAVEFTGPMGIAVGQSLTVPGDTNGDGRDDIVISLGTDGTARPGVIVIYGASWDSSPVAIGTTVQADQGYKLEVPFTILRAYPIRVGDVDGDGLADVAFMNTAFVPAPLEEYVVVFGREGSPSTPLNADPPDPGTGVKYIWDFANLGSNGSGAFVSSMGDLDGDGGDEFAIGSMGAQVNSLSNAGLVAVVNSNVGSTRNVVDLTPESPASDAFMLGGNASNQRFGTRVVNAGDVDADGRADLAVGAYGEVVNGAANAGMLGVIPTSRFYPGAGTGVAGSVGSDEAVLGGIANPNRRESVGYFEYGETAQYGQSTGSQSVGKSSLGVGFTADLGGLTADTRYHYRAVVVNDLGVKSYGADRTFMTGSLPVDRCAQDETLPGCPGYIGSKFCEEYPNDPVCQPRVEVARLSGLIVGQKTLKMKRGKKGRVVVSVVNTGGATATGVSFCIAAPKKLISIPRCKTVGSLSAGSTASRTFVIKLKKKAKRGKSIVLRLTAKADDLGQKSAKVVVKVR